MNEDTECLDGMIRVSLSLGSTTELCESYLESLKDALEYIASPSQCLAHSGHSIHFY